MKDADMVKETMKLHRGQLLLESTKAMMVKINRMGQGILKLLE
ncbi:MAG: flagellin [Lysinibacillus sp.]